jgi:XapX domain-containing protein
MLAFAIGTVCRLARIPSPAPNALLGSKLVVAMSVGYIVAERVLARRIAVIHGTFAPAGTIDWIWLWRAQLNPL